MVMLSQVVIVCTRRCWFQQYQRAQTGTPFLVPNVCTTPTEASARQIVSCLTRSDRKTLACLGLPGHVLASGLAILGPSVRSGTFPTRRPAFSRPKPAALRRMGQPVAAAPGNSGAF